MAWQLVVNVINRSPINRLLNSLFLTVDDSVKYRMIIIVLPSRLQLTLVHKSRLVRPPSHPSASLLSWRLQSFGLYSPPIYVIPYSNARHLGSSTQSFLHSLIVFPVCFLILWPLTQPLIFRSQHTENEIETELEEDSNFKVRSYYNYSNRYSGLIWVYDQYHVLKLDDEYHEWKSKSWPDLRQRLIIDFTQNYRKECDSSFGSKWENLT